MLDVTPEDIAALQDDVLRELVGRLCEATVRAAGLSPAGVTWSGHQDAADGGIDVRVEADGSLTGFIPSQNTGYQVKKPDLAPSAVREEMAPGGILRPSIKELVDRSGAYVIVSSGASVTDAALKLRKDAMRQAVVGVANGSALAVDFYDRRRLVTWLTEHPGLIPWIRAKAGRPMSGWQSYGQWAVAPEGNDAPYLSDERVRLVVSGHSSQTLTALEGLKHVRDNLSKPRKSVRVVGLSGVGKTRFVQALFEDIGANPLDGASVLYADMSDSPEPLPTALIIQLVAQKRPTVVVVDNCPSDLHRRLTELCRAAGSLVSVLTVEYDIRDDEPEGSETVKIEAASADLIERLIQLHIPELPRLDAAAIARSDISGGNARIALALARTYKPGESLSRLNDAELFKRLFQQRNEHDPRLLAAAEACALVYSFDAETRDGNQAELQLLAALIGQSPDDLYRHVATLKGRDLVQQRGQWRAVLPHAIGNRLAKSALKLLPIASIETRLVTEAPKRLARSFSRRLGYLHDSPEAVAMAERWLGRGGILSDVDALTELGMTMFVNVASLAPELALQAGERSLAGGENSALLDERSLQRYHLRNLVHHIAYSSALFDRCVDVLVAFSKTEKPNENHDSSFGVLRALFQARSSQTHATVDQRLSKIRALLSSADSREQAIGTKLLAMMLKTAHFSPRLIADFGNLARDLGYEPRTSAEIEEWFSRSIDLAVDMFNQATFPNKGLRIELASLLPGLCTDANVPEAIERLVEAASAKEYWQDAWISVRRSIRFADKQNKKKKLEKLKALERKLAPSNLSERIKAVVFCQSHIAMDLIELEVGKAKDYSAARAKVDALAEEYGRQVAGDEALFAELLSMVSSGSGAYLSVFGRGMGLGAPDPEAMWQSLRQALAQVAEPDRNPQAMLGFIEGVNQNLPALATKLLDAAVDDDVLGPFFPQIQVAVGLDIAGMARLRLALENGRASIWQYRCLMFGRVTENADPKMLAELLGLLASREGGHLAAIDILGMYFHRDDKETRSWSPHILKLGLSLLARVRFSDDENKLDYDLAKIASVCLKGRPGPAAARNIVREYRKSSIGRYVSPYDFNDFLSTVFAIQPEACLDAALLKPSRSRRQWSDPFEDEDRPKGTFSKIPTPALMAWCQKDPEVRFERVAAYVPYMTAASDEEKPAWTPAALEILRVAPNQAAVLERFVARFEPNSWSGSLAATIERRAALLLDLDSDGQLGLRPTAMEAYEKLKAVTQRAREWEEKHERNRDERFE